MLPISEGEKKTKEMLKYEEETGKFAIWQGRVTESFKKWKKGDKIYEQDKERITILVPESKKNEWQKFREEHNFTSISKLIRKAVDTYIESTFKSTSMKTISQITHGLKEPLTLIKGFSQIIIENYKDDLKWDVLVKINDIFDQSQILEARIKEISEQDVDEITEYDILIVDDDPSTVKVLTHFFELKGYKCKILNTGSEVVNEMKRFNPKITLLDILLPDIDGYEICKRIKSDDSLEKNLVFFITAIPGDQVQRKLEETKADGYFLKPFNFSEFNILFKYF